MDAFERLRSVQFDPIAPVGCNHDLVLQARVPGYKVGDWEKLAYQQRRIYDGWDKQASLVPFEGWPWRRYFYEERRPQFESFLAEYADPVQSMLSELRERGPLMPKEFGFQERRPELKSTWYSSNVTKRILRALWHTGQVMTSGRRKGQHLYDLTERVVPPNIYDQPMLDTKDAVRQMVLERHRAMGVIRPTAPYEVWSYTYVPIRTEGTNRLVEEGELIPVEIEGVKAYATPDYLSLLDFPSIEPRVIFVAPLDQLVWDRKMITHLFDFDYVWEIYVPEAKRRWGYYVLPVLFGDTLVARVEFFCREGTLEIRRWHFEDRDPGKKFFSELKRSLKSFMKYCSAVKVVATVDIDPKIRSVVESI